MDLSFYVYIAKGNRGPNVRGHEHEKIRKQDEEPTFLGQ